MNEISEYAHSHALWKDKYRRSGRTTRKCDDLIQSLFQNVGKEVQVLDHFGSISACDMLAKKAIRRLKLEHPHITTHVRHSGRCIYMSITVEKKG